MLRYAITDRALSPEHTAATGPGRFAGLVEQAARLAADGVDFLQVREKDLEAGELIGVARRIINTIGTMPGWKPQDPRPHLRVLINGRPDVALAAGADGVHLPSGAEQLTIGQVRTLFTPHRAAPVIVSVACHTLEEVAAAAAGGADLILFSPVFGKSMPAGDRIAGIGLERLAEACRVAGGTPVLALGGVTAANAQSCIDAGAEGIAGIRLFQVE